MMKHFKVLMMSFIVSVIAIGFSSFSDDDPSDGSSLKGKSIHMKGSVLTISGNTLREDGGATYTKM